MTSTISSGELKTGSIERAYYENPVDFRSEVIYIEPHMGVAKQGESRQAIDAFQTV